jgi:acetyl/propionyl-CoA carboxylase alpha subunit
MGTSFDSMVAKLIVLAPSREAAVKRMQFVLRETVVSGIGTNLEYLTEIAHHPKVIEGKVSTHFLDKEFNFQPQPTEQELEFLSAYRESAAGAAHASGHHAGAGAGVATGAGISAAAMTTSLWTTLGGDLK